MNSILVALLHLKQCSTELPGRSLMHGIDGFLKLLHSTIYTLLQLLLCMHAHVYTQCYSNAGVLPCFSVCW